jgi:hypothetical protein
MTKKSIKKELIGGIPISGAAGVGYSRKYDPYSEQGISGYRYSLPGWNLDEWLPELQGSKGKDIYRQMADNDPVCSALLFTIRMFFRSSDWYVQEVSDDEADLAAAEFLDSCMQDMQYSWHNFMAEVSSLAQFGFAPFEIVYKRRKGHQKEETEGSQFNDGYIGWKKLSIRAQSTILHWVYDPNTLKLLGLVQLAPPFYKLTFIPYEKLLLFTTEPNRENPEGKSILRSAYRPWYIKTKLENIACIGLEYGLEGLPVIWLPPNITNPDPDDASAVAALASFVELGKQLRIGDSGASVILPLAYDDNGNKLYDIQLLTTDGYHTQGIQEMIKSKSIEILQSAMADFLNLGNDSVGSFALSSDKVNNFTKAVETFLDSVEAEINNKAVPRLFALNPQFSVEKLPKILHKPLRQIDIAKVASLLQVMIPGGAELFPDLKLENALREAMGLPSRTEEEFEAAQKQKEAMLAQENAQNQQQTEDPFADLESFEEEPEEKIVEDEEV